MEFSIIQLADVAVKTLSPGINDPTTAKISIDRLIEILVVLSNRKMPKAARTADEGEVLFLARRVTYREVVALAFNDIRHFGTRIPSVAIHLLESLANAVTLVPPERGRSLKEQAVLTRTSALDNITDQVDLAEVEQAGR